MPVTNYYTVNGEIIGEQTTGQERIDYLTDPLGNVTATIDQNAKVLNRYTYKPFGEVLSKTGTAPDPKFLWVGAHGYRQTGKKYAEVYIRARSYDTRTGRWTSRDPLWPRQPGYIYAASSPVVFSDPSGRECNATNIRVRLDLPSCHAVPFRYLCFLCRCEYSLRTQFSLEWDQRGRDQRDCWVAQWTQDCGSTWWCRDKAIGWPYPHDCIIPRRNMMKCWTFDEPGIEGTPYCWQSNELCMTAVTCLCGEKSYGPGYGTTEYAVECYKWTVNFKVSDCTVIACEAALVGRVPSPFIGFCSRYAGPPNHGACHGKSTRRLR